MQKTVCSRMEVKSYRKHNRIVRKLFVSTQTTYFLRMRCRVETSTPTWTSSVNIADRHQEIPDQTTLTSMNADDRHEHHDPQRNHDVPNKNELPTMSTEDQHCHRGPLRNQEIPARTELPSMNADDQHWHHDPQRYEEIPDQTDLTINEHKPSRLHSWRSSGNLDSKVCRREWLNLRRDQEFELRCKIPFLARSKNDVGQNSWIFHTLRPKGPARSDTLSPTFIKMQDVRFATDLKSHQQSPRCRSWRPPQLN